ncbi:unnamed protein product, partial [Mesorhabditis spiculigera]
MDSSVCSDMTREALGDLYGFNQYKNQRHYTVPNQLFANQFQYDAVHLLGVVERYQQKWKHADQLANDLDDKCRQHEDAAFAKDERIRKLEAERCPSATRCAAFGEQRARKYYTDFLRPPLAPIYRPTAEEFTDPIAYVAKIKPEAEKYGVVKIVPPSDFVPTFAINGSTFKFTPRVQKLNEIEASIRERLQGINLDIDCSTDKLVEAGSNFGFYDANTSYNLDTFREFADKFKKEYSRKPLKEITLEEVEKESWWDIIREEAVSVKYGADLRVDKKQATKQEQQDGMRSV